MDRDQGNLPAMTGPGRLLRIWKEIKDLPYNQLSSLEKKLRPLLAKQFEVPRSCKECGGPFDPKRYDQVFCSKRCGWRWSQREYRARKKTSFLLKKT